MTNQGKTAVQTNDGVDASVNLVPARSIRWLMLLFVVALLGFWVYIGLHRGDEALTLQAVLRKLRLIADHPVAPIAAIPLFLLATQMLLPVLGLVALAALLFDAWMAIGIGLSGILLTTVINHHLGSRFHTSLMRRIPDIVTDKISAFASTSDVWTLAGLRLIPIAPFTVVNLVVGASGISLRTFLLATFIAMTPGVLIICLSLDRARAALSGDAIFEPWVIAAIIVTGIALIAFRLVWQKRKQRNE